ncbi:hypothetical protein PO318_24790, partial [Escherichia coli]
KTMTLSFFITVIPDHDKPQPPGCLLDAAEKKLAEAITNHAIEIKGIKEQHTGEIKELKAQHARSEKELQNRLDTELKARQAALDKALRDATDAREAKATLTGELQSLKTHNDQLAALLAGKK